MKIVAKALISGSAGKILVLRRSGTHPHFAHHLDFPGGEVEPGESQIQAVAREILEETGLQVSLQSLELAQQRQRPNGTLELVFTATLSGPYSEVKLSWEHDEYDWLTTKELLGRPMPPNADSFYETVVQYLHSEAGN